MSIRFPLTIILPTSSPSLWLNHILNSFRLNLDLYSITNHYLKTQIKKKKKLKTYHFQMYVLSFRKSLINQIVKNETNGSLEEQESSLKSVIPFFSFLAIYTWIFKIYLIYRKMNTWIIMWYIERITFVIPSAEVTWYKSHFEKVIFEYQGFMTSFLFPLYWM